MLAIFVIFLREGVEASMIVAILLAYLDRIGQRRHFRDIFAGVILALVLAGAGGAVAYVTIRTYAGSRVQTIFETVTYLLAAVVLTYMTFWMSLHARTISRELRQKTEAAIEKGERFGLGFLAFQAVGREGLETVVFSLAILLAAGPGEGYALIGAPFGLAASLAIAFWIYRLGRRLNIGRFFTVLGTVLMFFAAGLLADAAENLLQLGWVTVLAHPLWDTSRFLSEDSALGDIFHSLFGYADHPTVLQAIVYLAFLLAGFAAMYAIARSRKAPASTPANASTAANASAPAKGPAPSHLTGQSSAGAGPAALPGSLVNHPAQTSFSHRGEVPR